MSFNRNHYSSAPLMNMKKQRAAAPSRPDEPPVLAQPPQKSQPRRFALLQGLMSLALPVLFLAALLLSFQPLRWGFIIVAALSVLLMWVLKAFVQSARYTLTLIYAVLAVVIGVAILVSAPAGSSQKAAQKVDSSALFNQGSALDAPGLDAGTEEDTTPEPEATPAVVSAAQQRLEEFIALWAKNDTQQMLTYCTPSWLAAQEVPSRTLFNVLGLFQPVSYKIENVYGSEADASRAIQVIMNFSSSNGTQTAKRYQIFMNRVNDVWYVDPESLSSIGTVTEEDEGFGQVDSILTQATPAPTAEPTTNPATVLYYNPDGGSYYHTDPYCSANGVVKKEYLPYSGNFLYSEVNDMNYKNLKPCPYCNAPARVK